MAKKAKATDTHPVFAVTDASLRLTLPKLRNTAFAFTGDSNSRVNNREAEPVDSAATEELIKLPDLPPWLVTPLTQVHQRVSKNSLPHAILVHGAPGTGKRLLVEAMVALLLCEQPGQSSFDGSADNMAAAALPLACGSCNSCKQLRSGNHTDYRLLIPTEDRNIIRVGDTRDFVNWALLTANSRGGVKVGVIDSVEVMNPNAANSLLKTLEEPAAGTFIICIANWPGSLPATVTSRCQLLPVPSNTGADVEQWLHNAGVPEPAVALQRADGAALRALNEQSPGRQQQRVHLQRSFCDIVAARAGIAVWVERLSKETPTDCLEAYLSFTADILRVRQGAEKYCRHSDLIDEWRNIAPLLSTEQWFTLLDRLSSLYRMDNASIKIQPVLETIFAVIWQQRSKQLESPGA